MKYITCIINVYATKGIPLLHTMCLCCNIYIIPTMKCTCSQNEKSEFPDSTSAAILFYNPSKLTSVLWHSTKDHAQSHTPPASKAYKIFKLNRYIF